MGRSLVPVWLVVSGATALAASAGLLWLIDGVWVELAVMAAALLTAFVFVRADIGGDEEPRQRMHVALRVTVAAAGIGLIVSSMALRSLIETRIVAIFGFGLLISGVNSLRILKIRRGAQPGVVEGLDA